MLINEQRYCNLCHGVIVLGQKHVQVRMRTRRSTTPAITTIVSREIAGSASGVRLPVMRLYPQAGTSARLRQNAVDIFIECRRRVLGRVSLHRVALAINQKFSEVPFDLFGPKIPGWP